MALGEEFIRNCIRVDGPLLDRYRILSASHIKKGWITDTLKESIISWLNPRVDRIIRIRL